MRAAGPSERARVVALIEEGSQRDNRGTAASTAAAVLDHLEANGFRVAPAGLVANLAPLIETENALENACGSAGDWLDAKLADAAATIRIVRELAVTTLDLRPHEDGTGAQVEHPAPLDPWASADVGPF